MNQKKHFKFCQVCGTEQRYTTIAELNRAIKNNVTCRKCAGKSIVEKRKYREIPKAWFDEKKRKAEARGRSFEIDIKYIWNIYLKQDRKCALSGLPLDFDKESDNGTVSIDRINNDKGYIKRNIQLLHKDVNYAKWTFNQDYFIKLCKLIANRKC
jgi:hypothetical protein